MTGSQSSTAWWADHEARPGEGRRFTIGPLDLALFRHANEWQVAFGPAEDPDGEPDRVESGPISAPWDGAPLVERYAVGEGDGGGGRFRLTPVVADRSVVVRPRMPLFVPPGEEMRVFVSSPVWVRVEVGRPRRTLREVPVRRLSDTWFGPSTRDGELAYSIRSQARVRLEEVPVRYHRAITPVVLQNRSEGMLTVDRFSLPVPYLALFSTPTLRLWTERATMTHPDVGELAALEIQKGAPPEAGGSERVAEPRRSGESNVLVRAFSSLFSPFAGERAE